MYRKSQRFTSVSYTHLDVYKRQALIGLGLFTPLNMLVFCAYGIMFLLTARMIANQLEMTETDEAVSEEEESAEEIRRPENVSSLLQVDAIELEFGYGIIPLADVNQGGDLLDRVVMIRRQIALELGCVVPMIRLRDNIQLNPNPVSYTHLDVYKRQAVCW